jgi:hypothetical protein
MEALIALMIVLVGLVGLDLAAVTWGVDSREQINDDHVR